MANAQPLGKAPTLTPQSGARSCELYELQEVQPFLSIRCTAPTHRQHQICTSALCYPARLAREMHEALYTSGCSNISKLTLWGSLGQRRLSPPQPGTSPQCSTKCSKHEKSQPRGDASIYTLASMPGCDQTLKYPCPIHLVSEKRKPAAK